MNEIIDTSLQFYNFIYLSQSKIDMLVILNQKLSADKDLK